MIMKITTLPVEIVYLILDNLPSPVDKTCFRHTHSYFFHLHLPSTSTSNNNNIPSYFSSNYFLRGNYGLMSPLASRQPLKLICNELFPAVVAEGIAYRAEYILRCFHECVGGECESQLMLTWRLKKRFVERIDRVRMVDWEGGDRAVMVGFMTRLKRALVIKWNGFNGKLWGVGLKVGKLVCGLKMAMPKLKRIKWRNSGREAISNNSDSSERITSIDICYMY